MLVAIDPAKPFDLFAGYNRFLLTEMYFRAVITTIAHEGRVPFADKVAMAENYMQICPLYKHDHMRLQDALDRINPAYAGMTKLITCGESFYVRQGEWVDVEIGVMIRVDTYLHVPTQIKHTIGYTYQVGLKSGVIALDGAIVWGVRHGQKVDTYHELPALGVNALLVKLEIMPF